VTPRRPIVIVGTGRSGSTFLHRLLARHDEAGWLSTFNEVFPTWTWLSVFSGFYRLPLSDRIKHLKAFPKPFEAVRFWERYLPGFFSHRDNLPGTADVPTAGIDPVRRATDTVLQFQRRNRLLIHVTGWSRIAYFDRLFPDALFVWLRRDPRAVVSSWLKTGWLDAANPPDSERWQWGRVPPSYYELWREMGGGPLLSMSLKIRLDLDDIALNMARFPDRWHELWYEDLISHPEPTMRLVCDFAGLEWTPGFERLVQETGFYNRTSKWRRYLTEEQGSLVLEFLKRSDALEAAPQGMISAATP